MNEAAYCTIVKTMIELHLDVVTSLTAWQIERGSLTPVQAAADLHRLAVLIRSRKYANAGEAEALADALDAIAADAAQKSD